MAYIIRKVPKYGPWTGTDEYWAGICKQEDIMDALPNWTNYKFAATSFGDKQAAQKLARSVEYRFCDPAYSTTEVVAL